jgi:hypothetical protein
MVGLIGCPLAQLVSGSRENACRNEPALDLKEENARRRKRLKCNLWTWKKS